MEYEHNIIRRMVRRIYFIGSGITIIAETQKSIFLIVLLQKQDRNLYTG